MASKREKQRSVEESERFLNDIFSGIQDGISVLDKNLNIIRVNHAMERWYAHAMPLSGKKCYEAYHGRSRPCEICPTRKTLQTGKLAYEVVPKIGPKGKIEGWLDLYSFPLIDRKTGKMEGVIEYVRDITEQRRIEAERDRLFNLSMDMMCIVGFDGYFKQINPAWHYILGWTEQELLSKPYLDLVHPDDKKATLAVQRSLTKGNKVAFFENRYLRKDGAYRWLSWTASPVQEEERSFAIARDITWQKNAQELIKKEHDFTAAVLNTVGALIVVIDPSGRIVSFNKACEELTGYKAKDAEGRRIWDFLLTKKEKTPVKHVFKDLVAGNFPNRHENYWIAKSGDRKLISWSNTAIVSSKGKVEYVIGTGIDITEQKRAENALKDSEERYRTLFENAQDVIYSVSAKDETITALNPAFEKVTGWRRNDWLGKAFLSIIHPDDLPVAIRTFQQALAGKTPKPYELRIRKRSGEYVQGEFTSSPQYERGEIVGEFGIGRDITERKRNELALIESREKLRLTMDHIPLHIGAIDKSGKFILWNKYSEKMFGYTQKEVTGKMPAVNVHEKLKDAVDVVRTAGKNSIYDKEVNLKHKDGHMIPAHLVVVPYRDPSGKIMAYYGFAEDITERKRAENELKETKERLEYILGATKTGIDVIDSDFNLRYVDPAWQRTYGDPFGRKCYDYFMGRKNICPNCGIPKALREKKTVVTEEILPKEGNRVIEVHTIPFQDSDGKWLVAEFNIDITQRKRIEEMKENLIRDVSHELKTPIANAKMAVEMGERAMASRDLGRILRAHKMVSENIDRTKNDIDTIMKAFALGQKQVLKKQRISIKKAMNEVLRVYMKEIKSKKLKIRTAFGPIADKLIADKANFRVILSNLIDNAVKFTDKGTITLTSSSKGKNIEISVSDTGKGMSRESLERIFERFYKASSAMPGVGLGIPICEQIVEKCGGSIEVFSAGPGKGTRVVVTLPKR